MPNRIRELRVAADLSQEALGDMINVTKVTISDLERGKMRLDLGYMRRISDALGVAPSDLFSHKDNPGALSIDERNLIDLLRRADPDARAQFHKIAQVILPIEPPTKVTEDS